MLGSLISSVFSEGREFTFSIIGLEGRVDVGIGGGFLELDSRVGDVGLLVLEGGTGGGVFDFAIPVWWIVIGGEGELGESTLKAGVIRGVTMDCGRCRGAGQLFILLPEL